ncbi:M48 family metallopeptidase [Gramella sp. KN1008]|uniref:M48 family metallopeptidase n=1 Tax=Gramella sp. KN1008 TaxID=2529298 RepID=UPI001F60BEFC|nr:SprT family zinc-dependent metalloprotease [Gramella sp. KN1008]
METIEIGNIKIDVVRKDIKNMHLAVYPPNGRIRLSAPDRTEKEVLRLFAISKLGWIKKQVKSFEKQARETPREFVSGESHYFQGKRYLLEVIESKGKQFVQLKGTKKIEIHCKPDAAKSKRAELLKEWYRDQLKELIPRLVSNWEKKIGVKSSEWRVKQMKTKWGACNIEAKRIWLNLELAKKPKICLEYIIVHELVHLLERNHNDIFVAYMDEYMPKWRSHREELNSLPIAHIDWGY